jgi:hypothetical protein
MYLLDGLQLDKLVPPNDNAPCSTDSEWDVVLATVVTLVLHQLIYKTQQ